MPVLFQRMVFEYVPKNSPFWIRPIIRPVFNQLHELLVKPEIKNNLAMVCISTYLFLIEINNLISIFRFRLKRISKNQTLFFSQADKSQLSVVSNNTKRNKTLIYFSCSPQTIKCSSPWNYFFQWCPIN